MCLARERCVYQQFKKADVRPYVQYSFDVSSLAEGQKVYVVITYRACVVYQTAE